MDFETYILVPPWKGKDYTVPGHIPYSVKACYVGIKSSACAKGLIFAIRRVPSNPTAALAERTNVQNICRFLLLQLRVHRPALLAL